MAVYVIFAIVPILMSFVNLKLSNKKVEEWIKVILAVLPLFFLIAFRNANMGNDTGVYLKFFRQAIDTPWNKIFDGYTFEHGYLIFQKLCTCITHNELVFQCIYTLIYMIGLLSFLKNLDSKPYWTIFFYATLGLYTFMFTGVRQCLAMSICLFSYKFIKKRKLIPFVICVVLAYFFHKSALVFAFAYIIYNRKLNAINVILYIIITVLCVVYLDLIHDFMNNEFDYNYGIEEVSGGWIFTLFIVMITLSSMIILKMNDGITKENRGLINISIITMALWIIRLFSRTVERPTYYFMFFTCALLCATLQSIKDKKDKIVISSVYALLGLLLFVYRLLTSFQSLVPYVFFV